MSIATQRLASATLVLFGFALFGWLLYDAGSVVETLRLGGAMSEGAVAIVGLALVAAAIGGGVTSYWRSRRRAPAAG